MVWVKIIISFQDPFIFALNTHPVVAVSDCQHRSLKVTMTAFFFSCVLQVDVNREIAVLWSLAGTNKHIIYLCLLLMIEEHSRLLF